jgi:hypothetical protein
VSAKRVGKRKSNLVGADEHSWTVAWRWVVSILLCLHLLAVFAAPWADPPPSSDLARRVAGRLHPYLKFAALDNGYRFFAPDPGPSHLIRFELYDVDGGVTKGVFPDRDQHWPRLLYHRYFMVAEMIFSLAGPTLDLPPEQMLTEQDRQEISDRLKIARELQRGVADVLLRHHENATRVRLFTAIHAIPTPDDVKRGMALNDPVLYREVLLGEFERSDTNGVPR